MSQSSNYKKDNVPALSPSASTPATAVSPLPETIVCAKPMPGLISVSPRNPRRKVISSSPIVRELFKELVLYKETAVAREAGMAETAFTKWKSGEVIPNVRSLERVLEVIDCKLVIRRKK